MLSTPSRLSTPLHSCNATAFRSAVFYGVVSRIQRLYHPPHSHWDASVYQSTHSPLYTRRGPSSGHAGLSSILSLLLASIGPRRSLLQSFWALSYILSSEPDIPMRAQWSWLRAGKRIIHRAEQIARASLSTCTTRSRRKYCSCPGYGSTWSA